MPFNPFKDIFFQLSQIISVLQNNKDTLTKKGEIPPEAIAQLNMLNTKVDILNKSLQEALAQWGSFAPDPKNLELSKLPPQNAKDIKEANKYRAILEQIQRDVKKQLSIIKLRQKTYGKKGDAKKFGETRKKRLQRLGGDGKNWIPL